VTVRWRGQYCDCHRERRKHIQGISSHLTDRGRSCTFTMTVRPTPLRAQAGVRGAFGTKGHKIITSGIRFAVHKTGDEAYRIKSTGICSHSVMKQLGADGKVQLGDEVCLRRGKGMAAHARSWCHANTVWIAIRPILQGLWLHTN